jgi:hypothetical protein
VLVEKSEILQSLKLGMHIYGREFALQFVFPLMALSRNIQRKMAIDAC